MTLVDVLAGLVIIALTVVILAPLTVDARASVERSREALRLRAVISGLPPPAQQAGESEFAGLPDGCRLRWHSQPLPIANAGGDNPVTARVLIMQVVRGTGRDEHVLTERSVPLLTGAP